MLDPQAWLYGLSVNLELAIVQVLEAIIDAYEPSQIAVSSEKVYSSLCQKLTV
jgi:hypothetical protein